MVGLRVCLWLTGMSDENRSIARRSGIPILLCNIDMASISRIADNLPLSEHSRSKSSGL
jgi:hypothetical protein